MYRLSSSFVLGYHGCDRAVAEELLAGAPFISSENEYDWLGSGAYFWEANPIRGIEFAREFQEWRKGSDKEIAEPYVVGAVIDLGLCLDLMSATGLQALKSAYGDFESYLAAVGKELPVNVGGADLLLRRLDYAVINHLHNVREKTGLARFETVRGVFVEGGRLYPGAGFYEKTHIQICVRELTCIKGVFRVPNEHLRI